jgi:hypothetical protein
LKPAPRITFEQQLRQLRHGRASSFVSSLAADRNNSADDYRARLIGGTVTRGSVDKTLSRWASYERSRQLGTYLKDRHGEATESDHARV